MANDLEPKEDSIALLLEGLEYIAKLLREYRDGKPPLIIRIFKTLFPKGE